MSTLKVCRCCLSSDSFLIASGQCLDLLLALTASKINPPRDGHIWVCRVCSRALKKFSAFRELCLQADAVLRRSRGKQANLDYIRREREKFNVRNESSFSNTLCIDVSTEKSDSSILSIENVVSFFESLGAHKNFAENMILIQKEDRSKSCRTQNVAKNEFKGSNTEDNCSLFHLDSGAEDALHELDVIVAGESSHGTGANKRRISELISQQLVEEISKGLDDVETAGKINCKYCEMVFTNHSYLPGHYKYCKGKRSQQKAALLEMCKRDDAVDIDLSIKEDTILSRKKRNFVCDKCGKTFTKLILLTNHSVLHAQRAGLTCEKCGKTFKTVVSLNNHIILHTKMKVFTCEICGESFPQEKRLKSHILNHTGVKPFTCCDCGKTFKLKGHLKAHKSVHSGVKPFFCVTCGHAFASKHNLTAHNRTHTGERPFSCDVCGNSYTEVGYLKKHKRIHSGERPYGCKVCGKTFMISIALKTHAMTHTVEKPYACSQCSYTCKRSTHLKRHQLIHDRLKPK